MIEERLKRIIKLVGKARLHIMAMCTQDIDVNEVR